MIAMKIREIILADLQDGMKVSKISRVMRVDESTIYRLKAKYEQTGSLKANYEPSSRKYELDEAGLETLKQLVLEHPDITLEEIRESMQLSIKKSEISNILRNKLGFTFKKKMVHASKQKRPDIKLQREKWRETIKTLDVSKLVFLDESGVNINLTRRYGRAIGKERVYDYAPLNTPKSTTMLSSIHMDGTIIHQKFSGAVNREHFLNYVSNYLAPSLHPGDIVIMDNLCTHKVDGVQQAIQSAGAQVLYLPLYSPDFNPIKMLSSKIKSILRKCKARTVEL